MAQKAIIDRIDNLSCQEKYGAIVHLERMAHVSGIDMIEKDFYALIKALDDAGVPKAGSFPTSDLHGVHRVNNLFLSERQVTLVDRDKCDVKLIYDVLWNNEGQPINTTDPEVPVITGEVRVNIQQITTNKDKDGKEVTVQHTFSATDPDAGEYAGKTIKQSGEFTVYSPQRTVSFRGLMMTEYPWKIANIIVGYVNSVEWGDGGKPRTWLCTAANWKAFDIPTIVEPIKDRYYFTFEFQYNMDTWDPYVVFINPKTGKPPVGLVKDIGYKHVKWFPECDFNKVVGAILQGG